MEVEITYGWLILILGILFVGIFLALLRRVLHRRTAHDAAFSRTIFQVLMPKEAEEQSYKEEGINHKKDLKEVIAIAESLYAVLVGGEKIRTWNYLGKKIKSFFTGKHNHLTLEVLVKDGLIKFLLICPHYLSEYVEQEIHAYYPSALIQPIEDYNIFTPTGFITGTYLRVTKDPILPLKSYRDFETDPIDGILNTLSKVQPNEGAAIQILIRPAPASYYQRSAKIARELNSGKQLQEVLKELAPGSWWMKVLRLPLNILQAVAKEGFKNTKKEDNNLFGDKKEKNDSKVKPREEKLLKKMEEVSNKPWFEANVRVVVSAPTRARTDLLFRNIVGSFSQYYAHDIGHGFRDERIWRQGHLVSSFIFRNFNPWKKVVLSSEELASIFHFPLPSSEVPNIEWLSARQAPPPLNLPAEGVILGKSVYRGHERMVRLAKDDRRRHVYMIGKSGVGKSNLLVNMARQDIANGEGLCVIDPHGDLIEDLLGLIPPDRIDDVIVFDPGDIDRPLALNLLEYDEHYPEQKSFVINELINILDKLYDLRTTGGPMFEQYMRNALLLIMSHQESGSTLMEIPKVLADEKFRAMKLKNCPNQPVVDFWRKEAEKAGGEAALANMVPYITSKLTQFTANDLMRPIIGQQHSAFNFRDVMDKKKILLINLCKGKIGDMNAYLLGLIIVGKILMSALSRADMPQEQRNDFYLYIDEFQNFITPSIITILSEARKYRLNLIIAHQYMGQLADKQGRSEIKDAVLGNVGTMVVFRIGVEDAEVMAKEFKPIFNEFDLINIDKFTTYIKLLIGNQASRPFSMLTMPPDKGDSDLAYKIRELSRLTYGRPKDEIMNEIAARGKSLMALVE